MNWIRIEDRLPEKGKNYIIIEKKLPFPIVGSFTKNDGFMIEEWQSCHTYWIPLNEISHWCEITEPSKQRVIPKVPKKDRAVGK